MEKLFNNMVTLLRELFVRYPVIAFTIAFVFCFSAIKYFTGKGSVDKQLVNKLENTLSRFTEYGCSDASRFPKCIKEGKTTEILTRFKNIPNHKKLIEGQANGSATIVPGSLYEDSRIDNIARLIDQATSGCCTTLAISAVHKLRNDLPGHRVEMVASSHGMGSHCFIIFDRAGAGDQDLAGNNPNTQAWGRNVLIIDPWAQSLGHGRGLYTLKNYPFKYYLSNLTQTYDSSVDHKPVAASSSQVAFR